MNARRQIISRLSEDSLGGIATLQDVDHAEQLVNAHRAEVLAEVDEQFAAMKLPPELVGTFNAGSYGDAWRRCRTVVQAMAGDETAAPELTIYRASHDSIAMGLYTTAAAAREHCETEERRSWPTGTSLSFGWIEDEEDGVAELVVTAGQNEESVTGYVVTALEVASKYDAEADE